MWRTCVSAVLGVTRDPLLPLPGGDIITAGRFSPLEKSEPGGLQQWSHAAVGANADRGSRMS
jgi:hypothetical protein